MQVFRAIPKAQGLYNPEHEHDACGVGFVVNIKGQRSHEIVLKGLQGPVKVKGQQYGSAVMQPWDKTLTDQKIADVMTYERSDWGNKASPVTAEQIAALRKELASHPESFGEHDILGAPDEAQVG